MHPPLLPAGPPRLRSRWRPPAAWSSGVADRGAQGPPPAPAARPQPAGGQTPARTRAHGRGSWGGQQGARGRRRRPAQARPPACSSAMGRPHQAAGWVSGGAWAVPGSRHEGGGAWRGGSLARAAACQLPVRTWITAAASRCRLASSLPAPCASSGRSLGQPRTPSSTSTANANASARRKRGGGGGEGIGRPPHSRRARCAAGVRGWPAPSQRPPWQHACACAACPPPPCRRPAPRPPTRPPAPPSTRTHRRSRCAGCQPPRPGTSTRAAGRHLYAPSSRRRSARAGPGAAGARARRAAGRPHAGGCRQAGSGQGRWG